MHRITQIFLLMLVICLPTAFVSTIGVTAASKNKYDLTVAVSGNSTTSPSIGTHTYDEERIVDITATPAAVWQFINWSGDVSNPNSASTTVKMDIDKTVTSNFTQITQITNDLIIAVNGDGTTSPSVGIHKYNEGTVVNITATPAAGWQFINWSGDVFEPNSASTTVTMDDDKTVTANFINTTIITAPYVTSAKVNGFYTTGEVIYITVSFREEVKVDISEGFPYLELETGTANHNTSYLVDSRSDTLIFRYKVQDGDTSSDLDYKATDSLKLNGSTIRDTNDNDVSVTLAVPGETGSLSANKALVIDTTDPAVTVTSPSGGEIWAAGSSQDITWEANDANMTENPIVIEYYDGTDWVELATDEANDGSYTWTLPIMNISTAKVKITAMDKVGNTATHSSGVFIVNTTKPLITPDETSITTSDSFIRISGTITNVLTSIVKVEYLVDEGNWNNTPFKPDLVDSNSVSYDFNIFLSIGKHTVEVRATDNAGNTVYANPAITVERNLDSGGGSSLWITLVVVGVFCLLVILGGIVYFFFIRKPVEQVPS